MSAHSPFRTLRNAPTKTQIAMSIAEDTIEEYRICRMAAGNDAPETQETLDLLRRLAALMKGPHKDAVRPIVERAFPVLAAPQGTA